MITQKELKRLLIYDPRTGVFRWRINASARQRKGEVAGHPRTGYIYIGIDYMIYGAHRLAFLYMTGMWPKEEIGHENDIRNDNRWRNLSEMTHKQNMQSWWAKQRRK